MRYAAFAEHILFAAAVLWGAGNYLLNKHDKSRERDIFIEELRTNHLPHINRALVKIATKLGINLEE